MTLSRTQRGVAFGMAFGLGTTLISCAIAVWVIPLNDSLGALDSRLQILVLCTLLPALTLAVAIGRLAAQRFRTPQDINGSGLTSGTEQAKVLQALLQNTLEQLALSLPVYTAWAVLAPPRLMTALPVASLLFLLGRALFFWGYHRGAPSRSIGFTLTFYPTLLLLAGALILGFRSIGS